MNNLTANELYLFDLDGTLIDSNGVWLQIDYDFLSQRGLTHTAEYNAVVAHTTYQNAAVFTKEYYGLSETPEEIMSVWSDMALEAYACHIPLKPGVRPFLEQSAAAGIPLAIATSCMPHLCRAVLENNGIAGFFRTVTTTEEVLRDKKHPDVYLLAAEKEKIAPERCTVFEDSPSAARGALASGMNVVAVYDLFFAASEPELRKLCHGYIRDFTELLNPPRVSL